jgi:triosephosphate isomerase
MRPLIIANWKSNPTSSKEAKKIFNLVKKGTKDVGNAEVVICPPFIYLSELKTDGLKLKLGGQNCFWEEKGAFTGEISPKMLKDFKVSYVIVGHSERRKYQKETDGTINKKIKAVLAEGMKAVLCVDRISQIKKGLGGISRKELKNLILAYEPLFAIGTGKPCSPEKAKKMRLQIKKNLKGNNPVLYGGSVNSQNAKDYIKEAGFQGLLVGGASLKPKEFVRLVKRVDLVVKTC